MFRNLVDLIGQTPILRLERFFPSSNVRLMAKLEQFNPTGSVKDRAALGMILAAEEDGSLTPDSVIVEPTSGNTGIALASIAAAKGYRLIVTMPESMSHERRHLLKYLGAELILTPAANGMKGSIQKAEELVREHGYFMPSQFTNPANPDIHSRTTAREILEDLTEPLDYFVAGVGTGGTLMGVGRVLRKESPNTKLVAIEPAQSPVLSSGTSGSHGIQGIGAGFVPEIVDPKIFDEIVTVSEEEAFDACKELANTEGLMVGISSGAAAAATRQLAHTLPDDRTYHLLTVFPDLGERYLSIFLK